MVWYSNRYKFKHAKLNIAHITDCHLFANTDGEYFGVNTANYLKKTLEHIAKQSFDCVIFGGDLTQDHSEASYQLFADIVTQSALDCPLFWVPGNHDDIPSLERISQGNINSAKELIAEGIHVILVNSKGQTPAGWVESEHIKEIQSMLQDSGSMVFCHHNPLPINGYLDKHMLENGPQFLNALVNSNNVLAVFHGHVHHEYHTRYRGLDIYATPASSIQFKKHTRVWQQEDLGPAYRAICIDNTQDQIGLTSKVIWLNE
jgi:Icc protein